MPTKIIFKNPPQGVQLHTLPHIVFCRQRFPPSLLLGQFNRPGPGTLSHLDGWFLVLLLYFFRLANRERWSPGPTARPICIVAQGGKIKKREREKETEGGGGKK